MSWLSHRNEFFDSSGIRKVFDLASKMVDPINLSIGQPDFETPVEVRAACAQAIEEGRNGYTPTQGIRPLVDELQQLIDARWRHSNRSVIVTSGTSGGLLLAVYALVNPGDEVILFDPYFVMYEPLIKLVGGVPIILDTYPTFQIDLDKVESACTSKTKLILLNSPGNPTGVVASRDQVEALADLAAKRNVALLSDEIYRQFCYDEPPTSPAEFNEKTIVIDGFSKSHAMTGWRVGFASGPREVMESMAKFQQYSFVCAPQPAQWAAIRALKTDMTCFKDSYREKRNRLIAGLESHYEIEIPGGAFYVFPQAPWGTGSEFVEAAITNNLLVIPGNIFSKRDTHFRISYAASDEVIDRGIEVLVRLAENPPAAKCLG